MKVKQVRMATSNLSRKMSAVSISTLEKKRIKRNKEKKSVQPFRGQGQGQQQGQYQIVSAEDTLTIPLVLSNVFSFLEPQELAKCRMVSRIWKDLATPVLKEKLDQIKVLHDLEKDKFRIIWTEAFLGKTRKMEINMLDSDDEFSSDEDDEMWTSNDFEACFKIFIKIRHPRCSKLAQYLRYIGCQV